MIDLSQFLGKHVMIIRRNGSKRVGTVQRSTSSDHLYLIHCGFYTRNGGLAMYVCDTGHDIIHIELLNPKPMKKCEQLEQLEQQIKELQNEVDRLKKEEKEENYKLPKGFNRERALHCIKTHYRLDLNFLDWRSTPQGYEYWADIYYNRAPFTNAAIMQLQEWVILSYQQEYEKE